MGADLLATGHYARIGLDAGGTKRLMTGLDNAKDQTYFLFTLNGEQLQQVIFPVGSLVKPEVRKLAAEFNLPVAQKHESQEICFIPDNDYVRFLESNGVTQKPGDIVTSDGKVIGRHNGLHRHTIGQRKGLGIAWSKPLHVQALDMENNQLIVGTKDKLSSTSLTAGQAIWSGPTPVNEFRAQCRIRYRHKPAPCQVTLLDDQRFSVQFDSPQSAVTPGQAAVIYDGEYVLGGGWIE
jgi:tRNA-specific 2-thiouridylase